MPESALEGSLAARTRRVPCNPLHGNSVKWGTLLPRFTGVTTSEGACSALMSEKVPSPGWNPGRPAALGPHSWPIDFGAAEHSQGGLGCTDDSEQDSSQVLGRNLILCLCLGRLR